MYLLLVERAGYPTRHTKEEEEEEEQAKKVLKALAATCTENPMRLESIHNIYTSLYPISIHSKCIESIDMCIDSNMY